MPDQPCEVGCHQRVVIETEDGRTHVIDRVFPGAESGLKSLQGAEPGQVFQPDPDTCGDGQGDHGDPDDQEDRRKRTVGFLRPGSEGGR